MCVTSVLSIWGCYGKSVEQCNLINSDMYTLTSPNYNDAHSKMFGIGRHFFTKILAISPTPTNEFGSFFRVSKLNNLDYLILLQHKQY